MISGSNGRGVLKYLFLLVLGMTLMAGVHAQENDQDDEAEALTLITDTPDEGYELAVSLARRAISRTQPDVSVLVELRGDYANDADSLIAVSHVIAVHFQTVAEANNYWRE